MLVQNSSNCFEAKFPLMLSLADIAIEFPRVFMIDFLIIYFWY
jgi:hypothetical protein